MRHAFQWLMLVCCAGALLPAMAQQDPFVARQETLFSLPAGMIDPDNNWTHYFSVGLVGGMNIRGDFKMNGLFKVNNQSGKGIFDDGYVRPDDFPNAQGYTSFWGYQNGSQDGGSTLTMHSASSFTAKGNASTRGGVFPGIEMTYRNDYWYWGRMRVGLEGGFGVLPIHLEDHQQLSATITNSVFSFLVPIGTNGPITLPTPPYHGGRSGIGPQMLLGSTQQADISDSGTITGTRAVDAAVCTLRLGPSALIGISRDVAVSVSAGPVVGLVAGEYRYDEIIHNTGALTTQGHNHGSFGSADLVYGGYVNAMLVYHLIDDEKDACLFLGGEYMPMSSATFSNGGRAARIDLSGQVYVTAGIGWPF